MAEATYARIFGNQHADSRTGFTRINTSPVDPSPSMLCTSTSLLSIFLPPHLIAAVLSLRCYLYISVWAILLGSPVPPKSTFPLHPLVLPAEPGLAKA